MASESKENFNLEFTANQILSTLEGIEKVLTKKEIYDFTNAHYNLSKRKTDECIQFLIKEYPNRLMAIGYSWFFD